jgi:hypothetical protein
MNVSCLRSLSGCILILLTSVTAAGAQEWKRACSEGETCTIDGVRLIRYGAEGFFSYGVATNQVICSDESFGDPAPRARRKACWFQETATETRLAALLSEREAEMQRVQQELEVEENESAALRAELDNAYNELDIIYRRLGPGQARKLERAIRRYRERDDNS